MNILNVALTARRVAIACLLAAPLLLVHIPNGAGTASAKDARKAFFFDASKLNLLTLLAPPPGNASAETQGELAELRRLQATRTAAREKQAKADEVETVFAVMSGDLGPAFTADNLPVTAAFFDRVLADESPVIGPAKDAWGRPRPPLLDPSLKPCVKLTASNAYPSGHATVGYLSAIVLADMIPEKREAVFSAARRFAESRVICGVHYPSDIAASQTAAALISVQMRDSRTFQKEFADAKNEVRQRLGLDQ